MRVALATYAKLSALDRSDRLALDALRARGMDACAVVWDDPAARWDAFDAVVVRSCWDYHERVSEFTAWIDRVTSAGARLWNPAPLLRWNMDKRYLRELHESGVRTVPTAWIERGDRTSLAAIALERGWDEVVVKPVVSASGRNTWRASRAEYAAREQDLAALTRERDVMVQRFMPEIARDGEWSLVFIGGACSHAVRKRARTGEFRVQAEHGGAARAERASARLIEEATRVLERVRWPWLYARVDGCESDDGFVLMELEMLEPSLFLDLDHAAPDRFASALAGRLLEAPPER